VNVIIVKGVDPAGVPPSTYFVDLLQTIDGSVEGAGVFEHTDDRPKLLAAPGIFRTDVLLFTE
jgi:hypothetical protein